MKQMILPISILLFFSSCVMHWFVGDEVRWQIKNESTSSITALFIQGVDTVVVLSPEDFSLESEDKSRVFSREGLGVFNLGVVVGNDTLYREKEWMAGSYLIRVKDDELTIEER